MPFDEKDLAELEALKQRLPLAAVLFVKVEVNLDSHDDDFSSLHGADRVIYLKIFLKIENSFREKVPVSI